MDDDDIFNSITGGTTQPVQPVNTVPVSQPIQKPQDDDPFGLLNLNVGGSVQPQNTFNPPQNNGGFDMGLLGFGNPVPQPVSQPQPVVQNSGGFNLMGDDFLGLGGSQPQQVNKSVVNNVPPQSTGFSFDPIPAQNQGFNWGNQPSQQVTQAPQQPAGTKFLAYETPQIQVYMNCIKETQDTAKIIATYSNKTQSPVEGLTVQVAVMKHLKLTINPLNMLNVAPLSK